MKLPIALARRAPGARRKTIVKELADVQGKAVDIGGYYKPDFSKLEVVMRPSATFNKALASVKA